MSKKVVTCPGSGQNTDLVFSTSTPKVNCPHCGRRIEVHSGGKMRGHTALQKDQTTTSKEINALCR